MLISGAKKAIQSSTVHSFICQRHADSLPPHRYRRRRQSQGEVHEAIQIASLDPAHQFFKIDIQQSTNAHCSTPLGPHIKLNRRAESALDDKSTALDNKGIKLYQAIVGSPMYATLATRPDIAFAVAALCRYNASPQAGHLTAAQRVLRYFRATADYRLLYRRSTNGRLIGFTDSDWAGDSADRKSQGGYIFGRNGCGPISW